jgi:hypothetical protein
MRKRWDKCAKQTVFLQLKVADAAAADAKVMMRGLVRQWRARSLITSSVEGDYSLLGGRREWNQMKQTAGVILKEDGKRVDTPIIQNQKKLKRSFTCFMCATDVSNVWPWCHGLRDLDNIELFTERFGCVLSCQSCHDIRTHTETVAKTAHETEIGKVLLATWAAWLRAEEGELPLDSNGSLHTGVLFYKRCRASPWFFRDAAALRARTASS